MSKARLMKPHCRPATFRLAAAVLFALAWTIPTNAAQDNLIDASGTGNLSQVQAFLAAGADVSATGANGVTALFKASFQGHLDVVQTLLAAKADVNAKGRAGGGTALIAASQEGHLEVVQALLAAKADVNAEDNNGDTPLAWALNDRHADVAALLREYGGHE
jgi:serine/threonine-protein phosphatase 6 regulatory ankyrin repeat subunit B